MALYDREINAVARCLTLPLISVLSSITLVLAFAHAVAVTSYNTVLAHTALIFYSVTVCLASMVHASVESFRLLLHEYQGSVYKISSDLSFLALAISITFGWIITAVIWTYCEFSSSGQKVCPFESQPTQVKPVFDAARLALPWIMVTTYILHCGLQAMRVKGSIKYPCRRTVRNQRTESARLSA